MHICEIKTSEKNIYKKLFEWLIREPFRQFKKILELHLSIRQTILMMTVELIFIDIIVA